MLTLFLAFAQAADPPLPSWMAGCWQSVRGERWTEECWTTPRAGMMLGNSRSGSGETVAEWEFIQIVKDSSGDPATPAIRFVASPSGQGRTAFAHVSNDLPGISFLNADHDYPQRVRYWREGQELVAEISLADGSKARRWRYQPMSR